MSRIVQCASRSQFRAMETLSAFSVPRNVWGVSTLPVPEKIRPRMRDPAALNNLHSRSNYGGELSAQQPSPLSRLQRRNVGVLRGPVITAVQGEKKALKADGRFNPQTAEEAIGQAAGAVQRALADGKGRQQLQFLLPVDQRQFNFLDTEPRDYPCGIRQEFASCQKVVSSFFKETKKKDLISRRIGEAENEMDPVGLMYPSDRSIATIIFPIVETLKQIKSLASKDEGMPLLLVNPQWRSAGNIVSDFGFGPWRREKEDFVNTFDRTYALLEQRVGEASNVTSGSGGVVRILKCYPHDWQVYLMAWDGTSEMIGEFPEQPTYKELETLVAEARKTIPWKRPPRILGGSEPAPPPLPTSLSGFLSDSQIDEMEVTEIRRALMALDLPSSGRISKLKDRLKEAQKKIQN